MALMDTPNSEPAERLSNVQTFRSRPDLSPPTIAVTTQVHGTAPGYIFIAPKEGPGQDGPMILDTLGRLVWFSKGTYARDFMVQRYRSRCSPGGREVSSRGTASGSM